MIGKIQALIVSAQQYAKLIASVIGGLLVIGAQFIPAEYSTIVTAIVVVVTAFSVYQFPNVSDAIDE
jgi:hypothetical protein